MTATLPPHADVRDCRLYRFRVYHPDDMGLPVDERRIVIGYIGETLRQPAARLIEHLFDQPWADTIVGWDIDPRVFFGKPAVLEAERQAIRSEKPLYNVRENEANAGRIPPPQAIRQRRARDAAKANAPRWVHPDDWDGQPRPAYDRASPVRQRRSGGWRPWQRRLAGWGSVWLGSTVAAWIMAVHWHLGGWKQAGTGAAVAASVLVVWVMCGAPVPVGRWQRRARKVRRRLW
jgi:hypothetical protein